MEDKIKQQNIQRLDINDNTINLLCFFYITDLCCLFYFD